MIIVKIQGGLGNQMFQYAYARAFSIRNNTPFLLDIEQYKNEPNNRIFRLDKFNTKLKIATKNQIYKYTKYTGSLYRPLRSILSRLKLEVKFLELMGYVKERQYHFNEYYLNIKNNAYLDGYWQTEKYFKDAEQIIKNDFEFKAKPNIQNELMLRKIKSGESVAIHVRRGDFVSNKKTNEWHGTCPPEYFINAVSELQRHISNTNINFYIFSDDIDWAKNNIKLGNSNFVEINNANSDFEELRLISNCDHFILSNSSFSWWGAWLGKNKNKIVILPEQIYKTTKNSTIDFAPENWKKIKIKLT